MINKDALLDMARDAGLPGPEIVELRSLTGFMYWLYAGTAGNRACIEIDPVLDGGGIVREKIEALKGVPQTRGNQLVNQRPAAVAAPTAAPPPVTGLKARG